MSLIIYIILAALLGTAGKGKIEQGMTDQLRASLGPAAKINVEIRRGHRMPTSKTISEINIDLADFKLKETGGAESIKFRPGKKTFAGKIGDINISAKRFEAAGLPVKEMRANIHLLKYNLWRVVAKRELEIIGVDKCTGDITLEERGMNRFLYPRVKELNNFQLKMKQGEIQVSGWYKTKLRFSTPVTFTAALERGWEKSILCGLT